MKVRVEVSCFMEIDNPILGELNTIHKSGGIGTPEQYEEAIVAVEEATGFKFFDFDNDGIEHSEFRIVGVYDTDDSEAILEA